MLTRLQWAGRLAPRDVQHASGWRRVAGAKRRLAVSPRRPLPSKCFLFVGAESRVNILPRLLLPFWLLSGLHRGLVYFRRFLGDSWRTTQATRGKHCDVGCGVGAGVISYIKKFQYGPTRGLWHDKNDFVTPAFNWGNRSCASLRGPQKPYCRRDRSREVDADRVTACALRGKGSRVLRMDEKNLPPHT